MEQIIIRRCLLIDKANKMLSNVTCRCGAVSKRDSRADEPRKKFANEAHGLKEFPQN
jgi:hypothetical protein